MKPLVRSLGTFQVKAPLLGALAVGVVSDGVVEGMD